MERVLFTCKNLIGDGMNIYPALSRWRETFPKARIDFYTLNDHVVELYRGMELDLNFVYERPDENYDLDFTFDVGTAFSIGARYKVHITQAYYNMLKESTLSVGYSMKESTSPWELKYTFRDVELDPDEKNLILLSPFSNSCSSHSGQPANKCLKWETWEGLVELLRPQGRIGVLGGPKDQLPFPVHMHFYGKPLSKVAAMMKAARLVVTIDNGMAHLAASQKANTILFYPACLGLHWIVPVGNPNVKGMIQVDPPNVDSKVLVGLVEEFISDGAIQYTTI